MATYTGRIRRGLPRDHSGEPWPLVEQAPLAEAVADVAAAEANGSAPEAVQNAPVQPIAEHATATPEPTAPQPAAIASEVTLSEVSLRRGLPRVRGGEQWPPAASVPLSSPVSVSPAGATPSNVGDVNQSSVTETVAEEAKTPAVHAGTATSSSSLNAGSGEPLRRGLPRVTGGEAWPPAGFAPKAAPVSEASSTQVPQKAPTLEPVVTPAETASATSTTPLVPQSKPIAVPPTPSEQSTRDASAVPVPASKPVAAKPVSASAPVAAKLYGSRTLAQWTRLFVLSVLGAVVAAGIIVLAARGLTTFTAVQNFMVRYPGEYELPATAEPGFPAWVRWSHFLNMFFIVLIIRSGLLVRQQQKPPAFWTPKSGKSSKISINLWLHQSLDMLWLINGVVFVTLLFVTGHWMRIVPTSWEVFPNALSAMIQYLTLEWPVEDGWVNYNSLQQLMYFLVVFVAAPLAALTGARLSDLWPKKAVRLNRIYPVELARALHFPTMLFFVVFVIVHVALVFSTGALKNLNHMYSGTPEINWVGFWVFAGSILAVAAAWAASRPMILAPIASLFGKVSSR